MFQLCVSGAVIIPFLRRETTVLAIHAAKQTTPNLLGLKE